MVIQTGVIVTSGKSIYRQLSWVRFNITVTTASTKVSAAPMIMAVPTALEVIPTPMENYVKRRRNQQCQPEPLLPESLLNRRYSHWTAESKGAVIRNNCAPTLVPCSSSQIPMTTITKPIRPLISRVFIFR
jgi:hypothetical protein